MSQPSVYEQLCEIFGKKSLDYAIAEAKGEEPCTCGVKGADKCSAKKHKRAGQRDTK